jgi:hypothetical protein
MDAKVEISLSNLDDLRNDIRKAQARVADLEKQLVDAQLQDASGLVPKLVEALKSANTVVQFAVGNLDPTTVRGWPYEALRTIADTITAIPGLRDDADMRSLVEEYRNFAGVAAGLEEFRRKRDAERVVMPATAEDFGPKTAEAAFVHGAVQTQTQEEAAQDEAADDA